MENKSTIDKIDIHNLEYPTIASIPELKKAIR